jgi:hypothetical protein
MSTRAYPTTRSGWARHYEREYQRTGRQSAAVLASWYQLLHAAFGDEAV